MALELELGLPLGHGAFLVEERPGAIAAALDLGCPRN